MATDRQGATGDRASGNFMISSKQLGSLPLPDSTSGYSSLTNQEAPRVMVLPFSFSTSQGPPQDFPTTSCTNIQTTEVSIEQRAACSLPSNALLPMDSWFNVRCRHRSITSRSDSINVKNSLLYHSFNINDHIKLAPKSHESRSSLLKISALPGLHRV
jgi:hypothetical protein